MMIAFFASCFSVFPSPLFTSSALGAVRRPSPLSQVILFFLNRNSTPLEFCVLTARDRFMATP